MAPLLFLLLLFAGSGAGDDSYISAVISEQGLEYAKNILITQTLSTLAPLHLPDITKSTHIPFLGGVRFTVSNLTLSYINVNTSTVHTGESGVLIVASGAAADLSFGWRYEYSTWLVPFDVSDSGTADVKVEGMEVGLTMSIKTHQGTLALNLTEFGCYMKDISINLKGDSAWFYQGFINAFEDQIMSSVENAITQKIAEGMSKLNLFLQTLPKKVNVDDVASLNVTFTSDPICGDSYLEFDINGLFLPINDQNHLSVSSQLRSLCDGSLKMIGISLDEAVLNSILGVYFQAGKMHWIVDKVPQQSLLNTGSWKYVIPQLYRKYPNEDMQLYISLVSSPVIKIRQQIFGSTIFSEMTVNVMDSGETVSVACISVVVTVSGVVEVSGNHLTGKANLNDFSLELKWSNVGNFHMYLIQGAMRLFLNTVVMTYVNSHLNKGFPLPVAHGFTLQNADIVFSNSRMAICSDIVFSNYTGAVSVAM